MDDRESAPLTSSSGCWCVSKGLAGMLSQMAGLAQSVGIEYRCLSTPLRFPWARLPVAVIPRSPAVLRNPKLPGLTPPPQLVISCGRHGVIPALYLKKKLGQRLFAVHIQDPKTDPAQFDMVVVPRHDPIRGDNVYLTNGAIHYVTDERLESARRDPVVNEITDGSRPVVAVLPGGPNGHYLFHQQDLDRFVANLRRLVTDNDVQLVVLPSNRTPAWIRDRFESEFGVEHYVWRGQHANPYFTALAIARFIVVSADSVSMTTEAASTGVPVFVQHLTEKTFGRRIRRFRLRRFHEMFEQDGITRPFEGRLDEWSYEPPGDTPKVAQIIRERIAFDDNVARTAEQNRAA